MYGMRDEDAARLRRQWVVDPTRSTIEFRVKNFWGLSTVVGTFSRFDGSLQAEATGLSMELSVDATSVDTGSRMRDKHLQSPDFFDADAHPRVHFSTSDITARGDDLFDVRGDLETAGRTTPVSVIASVHGLNGEFDGELTVDAATVVDHRLLGMTWNALGMVRSPSTLQISARLVPESRTSPSISGNTPPLGMGGGYLRRSLDI